MNLTWPDTTDAPPLAAGDVHVWAVPLTEVQATKIELERILSQPERDRMSRFLRPEIGRSFAIGRVGLRTLLGKYLDVPPAEVPLETPASGKPRVAAEAQSDLQFNLAHSGELAVVGVTRGGAIGIDVERIRPVEHWPEIASRYFHADETAAIGADAGQAPLNFFRCWTRKEAVLKAIGVGIIFPLDLFRVPLEAYCSARVEVPAHGSTPETRYSLTAFDPCAGYVGALATACETHTIAHFTLRM